MKSVWLPAAAAGLVIIASTFVIKSGQPGIVSQSLISFSTPTPISTLSPSPTTVHAYPSASPENYAATYAKCGEIPNLPDYSSTRFRGEYSLKTWSPSCRFIAWSATIKYSFGPWTVSPYEGLFIYDLKTQKTTRLYTPQSESDSVVFNRWLDDTHLSFHQNLDSTDHVYNLTTQTSSSL